ncbi:MAG TPA: DUF5989 family protein [Steroidobacteraceae bacterium]|nr:DUF5989 family protein [Steroidobacteraceae bacterium]
MKKRNRTRRQFIVLGSAFGTIGELARGMWAGNSRKRWLLPLAVFLCITGMILILAASVEVLAPFIYALF